MKLKTLLCAFCLFSMTLSTSVTAQVYNQPTPQSMQNRLPRVFQFGLGFAPGLGAQAGYVVPYEIVTAEMMSYLNFSPDSRDNASGLNLAAGIGGSIRIMGLLNEMDTPINRNFDLDAGFRVGPKFCVGFGEKTDDKGVTTTHCDSNGSSKFNVQLMVEPFVRGVTTLQQSRNRAFFEAGTQPPYIRVGMWVNLN